MRLAQVVGKVTLNVADPALKGQRLVLLSPLSKAQLAGTAPRHPLAVASTPVAVDPWGATEADTVGFVEGAEATSPYAFPIPIDAYVVATLDTVAYHPPARPAAL